MMRIVAARTIFTLASIGTVRSFAIPTTRGAAKYGSKVAVALRLGASPGKESEIDDWYADFDPAAFDDVPATSPSSRGSDRTSTRTGGGSRSSNGHDYERDTTADNSNVNLGQVNALIADRLEARKTGRFQDADAIRDILLDEHGVSVWDKDKKWRSGSSRSGSGSRLGGRQDARGGGRDARGGRDGRERRDNRGERDSRRGPKQREFGPNGHDYQLSPGAGPIVSSMSEAEIHRKIAERLQCKLDRNFRDADAIQEEFERYGVYVHDGRKEWRADGERFGGDFERGGKPGREPGSRSDRSRPYTKSVHSEHSDDIAQIEELLNERMEAKKARAFQDADAIQAELRANFNVEINDKTREWSVGGNFGVQRRESGGPYVMASVSASTDDVDQIQSLVNEREEARKERDFDRADDIKDDLRDSYDVIIDDKLRQWSVGGRFDKPGQGPPDTSPFVRRGGGTITKEDEATIVQLLEERTAAKLNKDFGKADRIRDRLGEEFLVRLDDRSREWRIVTEEYVMSPVSAIDDDTKAFIEKKIAERSVAKLKKEYDLADSIRDELMEFHQVFLDDRVREWCIEGGDASINSVESFDEVYSEDDDTDDAEENDSLFDLQVDEDYDEEDDEEDDEDDDVETGGLGGIEDTSSEGDLNALTVPELKEKLRSLGLPLSGKKMELIARMSEHVEKD